MLFANAIPVPNLT